ncbi:hypothetical protein P7K49_039464 [Saguinus oedipus]|uniref:Uncharacterized protein n=1 Tax=Saguinus oedipus TaxID=9490 RepID=A0ABQ9TBY0_SAGOE|nr:hypothetical protein P7K49_039464 [Saguinus oedipus]
MYRIGLEARIRIVRAGKAEARQECAQERGMQQLCGMLPAQECGTQQLRSMPCAQEYGMQQLCGMPCSWEWGTPQLHGMPCVLFYVRPAPAQQMRIT